MRGPCSVTITGSEDICCRTSPLLNGFQREHGLSDFSGPTADTREKFWTPIAGINYTGWKNHEGVQTFDSVRSLMFRSSCALKFNHGILGRFLDSLSR
jgi:hypothetical protein